MPLYNVAIEAALSLHIDAPDPESARNAAASLLQAAVKRISDERFDLARYSGIRTARVANVTQES